MKPTHAPLWVGIGIGGILSGIATASLTPLMNQGEVITVQVIGASLVVIGFLFSLFGYLSSKKTGPETNLPWWHAFAVVGVVALFAGTIIFIIAYIEKDDQLALRRYQQSQLDKPTAQLIKDLNLKTESEAQKWKETFASDLRKQDEAGKIQYPFYSQILGFITVLIGIGSLIQTRTLRSLFSPTAP